MLSLFLVSVFVSVYVSASGRASNDAPGGTNACDAPVVADNATIGLKVSTNVCTFEVKEKYTITRVPSYAELKVGLDMDFDGIYEASISCGAGGVLKYFHMDKEVSDIFYVAEAECLSNPLELSYDIYYNRAEYVGQTVKRMVALDGAEHAHSIIL